MAGHPKKKLTPADLKAINRAGPVSLRYAPDGRGELRVTRARAKRKG